MHNFVIVLNATELYIQKRFKMSILSCISFTLKKKKKKHHHKLQESELTASPHNTSTFTNYRIGEKYRTTSGILKLQAASRVSVDLKC